MQVILKEDVEKLGQMGQVVEVKRGYARNYLIPKNLAIEATAKGINQLEHKKKLIADRIKKLQKQSQGLAGKIAETSVTLYHVAGEEDKIFGSVTSMEIAEALNEQGIEVDRRKIELAEPIKRLGEHTVSIKLTGGVTAELKVNVAKKEQAE
ncbi:MAG: 50S ribosomal protein L9 [Nitrospirota bacterium]